MATRTNPPPRKIPIQMFKDSGTKTYLVEQAEAIRLLWENQSGNRNTPTASDQFARRYALLVRR